MFAAVDQLASTAVLLKPKDAIESKLLNILVSDTKDATITGISRDALVSAPEIVEAGPDEISNKLNDIVAAFPRRFATVEEFDAATSENRRKFLLTVALAVLSELFLLALTISPFNTSGALRAIAHTLASASGPWRFTLIVRGIYISTLLSYSMKAYFSRFISSKEWLNVYQIALVGMVVELFLTLLVKKLNIFAFITRGVIAFYAMTLSSLASCANPEYIRATATA